jgi:hypothetical protein
MWYRTGTMTVTLTIKKVPVALARELRRRAGVHHRSLQGHLLRLLESAAAEPMGGVSEPAPAYKVNAGAKGRRSAPSAAPEDRSAPVEGRLSLAAAWERSRRIMADAPARAATGESVDIIRRDRDARGSRTKR